MPVGECCGVDGNPGGDLLGGDSGGGDDLGVLGEEGVAFGGDSGVSRARVRLGSRRGCRST